MCMPPSESIICRYKTAEYASSDASENPCTVSKQVVNFLGSNRVGFSYSKDKGAPFSISAKSLL